MQCRYVKVCQFVYKQDVNGNQSEYLVEALIEDQVHSG